MMAHACNPQCFGGVVSRPAWSKNKQTNHKNNKHQLSIFFFLADFEYGPKAELGLFILPIYSFNLLVLISGYLLCMF